LVAPLVCPHQSSNFICATFDNIDFQSDQQFDLYRTYTKSLRILIANLFDAGYVIAADALHISLFVLASHRIRLHRHESLVIKDFPLKVHYSEAYWADAVRILGAYSPSPLRLWDNRLDHQFLFGPNVQSTLDSSTFHYKYMDTVPEYTTNFITYSKKADYDADCFYLKQLIHELVLPYDDFGYYRLLTHLFNVHRFIDNTLQIEYYVVGKQVEPDKNKREQDLRWLVNFLYRHGFYLTSYDSIQAYYTEQGHQRMVVTQPVCIRRIQSMDILADIQSQALKQIYGTES
jgi:hypothetical protein